MGRLIFIVFFPIIVGTISWGVPEICLTVLVLGTGFPHIILGAKYSKAGLLKTFNAFWRKSLFLFLIPLSIIFGIKLGGIGLVFYFALHHSISETYSHKTLFNKPIFFNFLHGSLIFSSFLIACRDDFLVYIFLLRGCYLVFFTSLILLLILGRKHLLKMDSLKKIIISFPWILAAPVLVLFTYFAPISWMILILFHFTFWGMLPLFRKKIFNGDKSKLKAFWKDTIKWNVLGTIGFAVFGWFSYAFIDFRLFQLAILIFYIATYWHISISFIISGANPPIVRNLFGFSQSKSLKRT